MSASMLTVACRIRGSAGSADAVVVASRPQAHWMVPAEKTSAPLAARYMRQVVGGGARHDGVAEVGEVLRRRPGGRRQADQAGRPEAVVDVLVGLVADGVWLPAWRCYRWPVDGQAGVPPQPELAFVGAHRDRRGRPSWP